MRVQRCKTKVKHSAEVYSAATSSHRPSSKGAHSGMVSCVSCDFVGFTPDMMKQYDELDRKVESLERGMERLEKSDPMVRQNIGVV